MPFDDDEWKSGRSRRALESKILGFLQTHHESAFTREEIAIGIGLPKEDPVETLLGLGLSLLMRVPPDGEFDRALKQLVEDGKVEERSIKDGSGAMEAYRYISD